MAGFEDNHKPCFSFPRELPVVICVGWVRTKDSDLDGLCHMKEAWEYGFLCSAARA